jgi:long-chain acyl-CoA synthetase
VRICDGKKDTSIFDFETLDELFKNNVERFGDQKCLGYREVFNEHEEQFDDNQSDNKLILDDYIFLSHKQLDDKLVLGDYIWLTYKQVDEKVKYLAKGLCLKGVKPGDTVMIFAETKAEWLMSAYAIFRIGAHIATLFTTVSDDSLKHAINEINSTHIITSSNQLAKLKRVVKNLHELRTIIYFESKTKMDVDLPEFGCIQAFSLSTIEELGKNSTEQFHIHEKSGDDTAIIMYTPGKFN